MRHAKLFSSVKSAIILILIFLFPLFFLTTTAEFFVTNKLFLLAGGALLLLIVSTVELLVTKRIVWEKKPFDNAIVLFLMSVALSTLIVSPNKIQALLNPSFGLIAILSLTILYFYISRNNNVLKQYDIISILNISGIILALITIVDYFQLLKALPLPSSLLFLKNQYFSPMGGLLETGIFLGFLLIYAIGKMSMSSKKQMSPVAIGTAIVQALGLIIIIYALMKPFAQQFMLQMPPFTLSWYAAVETMKHPLNFIFGIGVDNFSSIFTRVKDLAYNQSAYWQVNFYNTSRSTILHVFTESGLFGLVSLVLLLGGLFKYVTSHAESKKGYTLVVIYLVLILLLFPPSLPLFFLLFVVTGVIMNELHSSEDSRHTTDMDLHNFLPLYLGMAVVSTFFIIAAFYLLGRAYVAEYAFKKSFDGASRNDAKALYDNQREAVIMNRFMEKYRINFAQTNLIIANNIASKAQTDGKKTTGNSPATLSDQDKQIISQAIQAAIAEAKASVALNPQKASNWEVLSAIYRNVLGVAEGADSWTIAALQRAVALDPQNPNYRLNLGGIYYSLKNYDDSIKLFEQATTLKPDWANAYYNLAWATFQKGDSKKAAEIMQQVLKLTDPKTQKADYDKAKKELEQFQKQLPPEQPEATQSSQLNLAPTPKAVLSPKLELPNQASPEAEVTPPTPTGGP